MRVPFSQGFFRFLINVSDGTVSINRQGGVVRATTARAASSTEPERLRRQSRAVAPRVTDEKYRVYFLCGCMKEMRA